MIEDTITLPLTKGYVTVIDKADAALVAGRSWYVNDGGDKPYVRGWDNGRQIALHRLLMQPGELVVDHIDGNPLNNRRSNLRVCTQAENARNKICKPKGSSRFKGVHLTPSGSWRAQVRIGDKRVNLGNYTTEKAAARAYDKGAIEAHGEFAMTNVQMGLL